MKNKQNSNSFRRHNQVIDAFQFGAEDKRLKKPYKNPYCRNKQKEYWRAYKNGFER